MKAGKNIFTPHLIVYAAVVTVRGKSGDVFSLLKGGFDEKCVCPNALADPFPEILKGYRSKFRRNTSAVVLHWGKGCNRCLSWNRSV